MFCEKTVLMRQLSETLCSHWEHEVPTIVAVDIGVAAVARWAVSSVESAAGRIPWPLASEDRSSVTAHKIALENVAAGIAVARMTAAVLYKQFATIGSSFMMFGKLPPTVLENSRASIPS